ncbi:hypothetical protein CRE_07743 [Caenorhabditis remanei]|uniref:RING-type domain-containing protein n=1 Tax=Caenorhabditis remanei TaxID=31234 RepID=E3N6Q8_CAERE|nr:hypothetical protein CRE_07743 [Caenorhabditis remanei]
MPRRSSKKAKAENTELRALKKELLFVKFQLKKQKLTNQLTVQRNEKEIQKLNAIRESILTKHRLEQEWEMNQKEIVRETRQELEYQEFIYNMNIVVQKKYEKEMLKKEQEVTRQLERRNKELKDALDNGISIKPWKQCGRCFEEFGEKGVRVPKVLECGHTLCVGCLKQIAQPYSIECPFDGLVTDLDEKKTIDTLPKNFIVFNM